MMCRCTRFHADQRRRQLAEELDHTAAPQLPCNDDFADCIDAVNLKDVLGEIDADCGNLHVDGPHGDAFSNDHPLAHSRWPGAGAVHPISFPLPLTRASTVTWGMAPVPLPGMYRFVDLAGCQDGAQPMR